MYGCQPLPWRQHRRPRRRRDGVLHLRAVPQEVAAGEEVSVTDTSASPSPFRRFPWVQLAFCLACLTMTAWTWMRYSYCWEVCPCDLFECRCDDSSPETRDPSPDLSWRGRYVRIRGRESGGNYGPNDSAVAISTRDCVVHVWFPAPKVKRASGQRGRVVGQVQFDGMTLGYPVMVDASASRLHPASVGGLFVGVMGYLVFRLYLFAWLRERKALAGGKSEPQPREAG